MPSAAPRAVAQNFAGFFVMAFKGETGCKVAGAAFVLRSLRKAEEARCVAFGGENQSFAVGGGSPEGRAGAAVFVGGPVGRGRLGD